MPWDKAYEFMASAEGWDDPEDEDESESESEGGEAMETRDTPVKDEAETSDKHVEDQMEKF